MTPDQIHRRYRNIKLVAWGCIALALVSAGIGLGTERDYAEAVSVTPRILEPDKALRDLVEHPEPGPAVGMIASWYGEEHAGHPMANGELFDPWELTCAHRTLPLGTRLRVSFLTASVDVEVTDRGPELWTGHDLDLSAAAFARLPIPSRG